MTQEMIKKYQEVVEIYNENYQDPDFTDLIIENTKEKETENGKFKYNVISYKGIKFVNIRYYLPFNSDVVIPSTVDDILVIKK